MCIIIFNMGEGNSCMRSWFKLALWVTSLSDTPRLQYYDVQFNLYFYEKGGMYFVSATPTNKLFIEF
jgi:hypothetical protein